MRPILPWSYSSLTSYETCPYRYWSERIAESVPKKVYAEADEGVKKHALIEKYLKGEAKISDIGLRKLVDNTLARYSHQHMKYEHKLAITKDRAPCEWDHPSCYHRGILDVLYANSDEPIAAIFDWKNGKVNEYSEQLKANSILVFDNYPNVQSVHTEYVWMSFGKITSGKNFRDFSPVVWQKFVSRVDRLEQALEKDDWPKRPSGLCRKYCPVTSCEHNGDFQRG